MPGYHFTAVNLTGQEQKGMIEAENEKHARQLLRDRSLIPIQVRSAQGKRGGNRESVFAKMLTPRKLSSKEIAQFTRQFATLLAAGLPLEESLVAVAEQTEKSRLKGLILSVRGKVLEGHSLAAALREHPEAFSPLFTATIAAGERSGHLDKVLMRLADYTEQQWNMRQKLKTALIYPVMIVLVAIGIVGFLLAYVVPKMVAVYSHLHQTLPLMTIILISISNFLQHYGLFLLIIITAGVIAWRYALKKNESLRVKTHFFLLRLPLIGYAIRTADTARFERTLSILAAAGVPLVEAMGISAKLISNIPIRNAVDEAVHHVREGASFN